MAVTITIPTALRQYAGGQASLTLEAETVGTLLHGLVETILTWAATCLTSKASCAIL